jgi:Domain of unknown function (DUF4386)
MHPTDKAARVAGAVYLSMVFTAPFTLLYVPGKLIVRGDAAATANNILTHETMFRLAIIGDLFTQIIFICLGIALYRLLSSVNKTWAIIGVWLIINCFGYVALSIIGLMFPTYYNAAFRWAQPVLFGELAIMLWLLIKGAKVQTLPVPAS